MRQPKQAILASALVCLTGCDAIWQPKTGDTWQIILTNASAKDVSAPWPNITAFDADLFDVPKSSWESMDAAGIHSICYFSAGSWEDWRPDADKFPKKDIGKPLDGWPGENWLNITSPAVRAVMAERLDLAKSKGCHAVDPDNVDVYDNGGGGFGLTSADSLDYVKFLAAEAHKRGMACGLKNALKLIPDVLDDVQFAVNEQCVQYEECDKVVPFTKAGKPVFGIEYPHPPITTAKANDLCDSKYRPKDFSTLVKYLNLNVTEWPCPILAVSANATYPSPASSSSSSAMPTPTKSNAALHLSPQWIGTMLSGISAIAFAMLL